MQTVLKTVCAILLALGFLLLDARGAATRPIVAFLGLRADTDPLFHAELTKSIRRDLSADTSVASLPASEIDKLSATGALKGPEISAYDIPKLSASGAQYYAFGWMEPVTLEVKRKWTKPWDVNVRWSQSLRLRVLGPDGSQVYDGLVPAEISEKSLILAPDAPSAKMAPADRDRCERRMLPVLSEGAAKMLAKVITERAAVSSGPLTTK